MLYKGWINKVLAGNDHGLYLAVPVLPLKYEVHLMRRQGSLRSSRTVLLLDMLILGLSFPS